jgi:hypothetical protein
MTGLPGYPRRACCLLTIGGRGLFVSPALWPENGPYPETHRGIKRTTPRILLMTALLGAAVFGPTMAWTGLTRDTARLINVRAARHQPLLQPKRLVSLSG